MLGLAKSFEEFGKEFEPESSEDFIVLSNNFSFFVIILFELLS